MTFRNRFAGVPVVLGAISAVVLILLSMPARAGAASYFVVGRVYSAAPLVAGDTAPSNPLSGVAPAQVVGANLVASVPRNLVKVRVLAASDGHELASYITRQDGGYLASFSVAAPSVSVRFVVDELATSKQLLYSEPSTLTPPVSVRYLLVNEASTEISSSHMFAPPPPPPAMYTAIFTRVGKIELATQVGGVTQHLIDPTTGLANVPASVASDLSIPQYQDAPFGGNLFLFGAFSQALYSLPNVCYKIRIYPNPSDHTIFTYMSDELVKTKYTVDFTTGTVAADRVTIGPKTVGGIAGCYELTPISPANNVFWSFPDLVGLWRTAGSNGDFGLEFELFGLPPGVFGRINNFTNMTLMLDNVAPVAQILPLQAGDFDTPRVYTPGPAPAGADLTNTLLGSFPVDYGGTADPTCLIFNLQPPAPAYLTFKLTANHASSYLRYWQFGYERNDKRNEIVLGKSYDGTTHAMVDLPGVRVSSAVTSAGGFENKFLYLDSNHLEPAGPSHGGCAYRFVVRAATRTTDGYNYLWYAEDQDLHYIQK